MTKQTKKITYGVYYRKSSEAADKQAYSIQDQIRDTDAVIQKEKIGAVKKYEGESQSAFKIGRPIFDSLVNDILNGIINAILVWHPNRLARNPRDGGMLLWLMDEGMLKEIRTPGRVYHNTASDKFMLQLEFGMSKKDSDDKSEVVKRALVGRAERGLPHGLAPVGFINDTTKEKGNRDWLKDPVRYPMVETILRRMLTGKYTAPEIHVWAKEELKLTTIQRKKEGGQPIARSYIYTLLRNPMYAGFFFKENNGEKKRYAFTAFEPMITEEEYWKIQNMLGKKGVPRIRERRDIYHRFSTCGTCNGKISTDYKFQVICPACKKKFAYLNLEKKECPSCKLPIDEMKEPTFLAYIFYYCINNKKHRTNCPGSSIEKRHLEEQIASNMNQLTISKELSAWCIENIGKVKDPELEDAVNKQKNLEQERISVEGKLKRLTMLRISRDCSTEENENFNKLEQELNSELSLLTLKLSDTNIDWFSEAKKDFDLMSDIPDILENGTDDQKMDLFLSFRSNLIISDKKLVITYKKSIEAFKSYFLVLRSENKAFEPENSDDLRTKEPFLGGSDAFFIAKLRCQDSNLEPTP